MTGCGRDEADRKTRDLQETVRQLGFDAGPGETISLRVSAGAASYPADGDDYDALLASADRRMYMDKGRDRVQDTPQPITPPGTPGSCGALRLVATSGASRTPATPPISATPGRPRNRPR